MYGKDYSTTHNYSYFSGNHILVLFVAVLLHLFSKVYHRNVTVYAYKVHLHRFEHLLFMIVFCRGRQGDPVPPPTPPPSSFLPSFIRSPELLRRPIDIGLCPSSSVNNWAFWLLDNNRSNSFQNWYEGIFREKGHKLYFSGFLHPWGFWDGAKTAKVDKFKKYSSLQSQIWKKNLIA